MKQKKINFDENKNGGGCTKGECLNDTNENNKFHILFRPYKKTTLVHFFHLLIAYLKLCSQFDRYNKGTHSKYFTSGILIFSHRGVNDRKRISIDGIKKKLTRLNLEGLSEFV